MKEQMHTQYNQVRLNQFRENNENEDEDGQSAFSENQSGGRDGLTKS